MIIRIIKYGDKEKSESRERYPGLRTLDFVGKESKHGYYTTVIRIC